MQCSLALLGLAMSVGTTGTLTYELQDDLQAQTVPTKFSYDALCNLSKTYNQDAEVISVASKISTDRIPKTKFDPTEVSKDIGTSWNINAEDSKNSFTSVKEELYKVQPGDTVSDLAIKFKTSKKDIIALNQLQDPDFLAIGQELAIPGMQTVAAPQVELPKFIPTISQEIRYGNRALIDLAARFGILPTGGEAPVDSAVQPVVKEEKIAALPVTETPQPIGVEQPVVKEEKIAALPVTETPQPIGVEQPVVKEEKIAALPVTETPQPIGVEQPVVKEEKIAALPVTETPQPIGVEQPVVKEEKIAALPVTETPQPIGVEQPVVKEEKIAALPVTETPQPIGVEQPVKEDQAVTLPLPKEEKTATLPTEKTEVVPTKVAALTTIEIVRQPAMEVPPGVKTPQLPPLPKAQPATPDPIPQKLAAINPAREQAPLPLTQPATEESVTPAPAKTLHQEVKKLRQELHNPPVQKIAAINPSTRSGLVTDSLGKLAPELPALNAANFLPDPANYGLSEDFVWPASGIVTSGFGWRWGRLHQGIDIAAPVGTPIWAAASGVVQFAGWNDGGYGYMIDILHANGTVTRYAHMSALYVKVGQRVQQGQVIGAIGSTGYSTGPHLHFEVRPNGGIAVNPMTYLAAASRPRSAG
jgi:murein DD-endopeptidase MepM/ murein hydrolase activator NlpD